MNILTLPQRRAFDAAFTAPPASGLAGAFGPDQVTVLLLATGSRFTALARPLPQDWRIIRPGELAPGGRDPDIVVLDDPGPKAVTANCLRHPAAAIVVVLSPYSDHQEVVDVLEAGADACVRSDTTAVIAAHVEACRRRQAA